MTAEVYNFTSDSAIYVRLRYDMIKAGNQSGPSTKSNALPTDSEAGV